MLLRLLPSWPSSSLMVFGFSPEMLKIVHMLSRPPLATRPAEGEKETVMTQADLRGTQLNWGWKGEL